MLQRLTSFFSALAGSIARACRRVVDVYRPSSLRERSWLGAGAMVVLALVVIIGLVGWYWDTEPEPFDVTAVAVERAGADSAGELVVGYTFTSTLMRVGETLLDKRGGYLSNDVMPPGVLMDNIPNWEFGALVMLRDASAALRNHFARSQSQSVEDPDLARAEPQFNFQNDSWILPATESEYRDGLEALQRYLERLADPARQDTQFFARADNLRLYLEIMEKRLGSLSQRLSASVGGVRENIDLAGDPAAQQATGSNNLVVASTPWLEIDDVFYEARGTTWALLHLLKAAQIDFRDVLEKKNAVVSLRQIIRELEATQQWMLSPVILNGSSFGLFANYSLTMANYIARANAAMIDLRELLQQG